MATYSKAVRIKQKYVDGARPVLWAFVRINSAGDRIADDNANDSPEDPFDISDGASHPVSAFTGVGKAWADLTACQVDYPHVTAPTDQLAWAAIVAALASIPARGGQLFIPRGTYILSGSSAVIGSIDHMFEVKSNLEVYGEPGTILKAGSNSLNVGANGISMFGLYLAERAYIHDLFLDLNGTNNLVGNGDTRFNHGIYADGCSNCLIERVTVKDTPGRNSIIFGGGGGGRIGSHNRISDCVSINGGTSLAVNEHQVDFSAYYVDSDYTIVENCKALHDALPFTNCGGIELHGNYCEARGNIIQNSFPGMYMSADYDGQVSCGQKAIGNTFKNCHIGIFTSPFGFGSDFKDLQIRDNTFELYRFPAPFSLTEYAAAAIYQPNPGGGTYTSSGILSSSEITGNIIRETYSSAPASPSCHAFIISAVNGLRVTGNTVEHITGVPIIVQGCPSGVKALTIEGNRFKDWGDNSGAFSHAAILFDISGSATSPSTPNFDASEVHIQGNVLELTAASANHYGYQFYANAGSTLTDVVLKVGSVSSNLGNLISNSNTTIHPWTTHSHGFAAGQPAATSSEALAELHPDAATQGSVIRSTSGFSSTYNGVSVASNDTRTGLTANTALPSWKIDIGGRAADDVDTESSSADAISFFRRAAAGVGQIAYKIFGRVSGAGTWLFGRELKTHVTNETVLIHDATVGAATQLAVACNTQAGKWPFEIRDALSSYTILHGVAPDGSINVCGMNCRIYAGYDDPSAGAGFAAALGSLYLNVSSGRTFAKYGAADTAWRDFVSNFFGYGASAPSGSAPVPSMYLQFVHSTSPAFTTAQLWVQPVDSVWVPIDQFNQSVTSGDIYKARLGTNGLFFKQDLGDAATDGSVQYGGGKLTLKGGIGIVGERIVRADDKFGVGTDPTGTQYFAVSGGSFFDGYVLLDDLTASTVLVLDASKKCASSDTTLTEMAGLHGLTGSRALATNPSGILVAASTTAAELDYVNGVKSAIQTQLDGKAADVHYHAGDDITSGTNTLDVVTSLTYDGGGHVTGMGTTSVKVLDP